MRAPWISTGHRVIHDQLLRVEEHDIETADGRRFTMPVLRGDLCAAVLPVHDDGTVTLVRQHRYALGRDTLEIPGGRVDHGEAVEEAGRRELQEETGLIAGELRHLGTYSSSLPIADETVAYYLAYRCKPSRGWEPDPDTEPVRLTIADALAREGQLPADTALLLRALDYEHLAASGSGVHGHAARAGRS